MHIDTSVNPLWGHRSISIVCDLRALQPYFLVVMVTPASPFLAYMQLRDKRWCWRFEKTSVLYKSCRFGLLKLRFPSSPRPAVELYAVLVLVSGLLSWKWTICQRSIPAAIWTTAWFVRLSFVMRELCFAGEAWKFVRDVENLRCNARSNTPRGFGAVYAFFLMTSLWEDFWQTFQCATNFWICFFFWSVRQKLSDKVRL